MGVVTGDRGDAGCERSGGHMVAVHTEQEEQRSGTLSVVRAGRKRRVERSPCVRSKVVEVWEWRR